MNAFKQPIKPKYSKGQFVFTIQNTNVKSEIKRIDLSIDPNIPHRYKVLCFDNKGVPFFSHWFDESEISTSNSNHKN